MRRVWKNLTYGRERLMIASMLFIAVLVTFLWMVAAQSDPDMRRLAPGRGSSEDTRDPFAWSGDRQEKLEERAAAGFSHVLFTKSPGGVVATARRVDAFRGLIDRVATETDTDASILEAIVFLESAGRPDARASDDLTGAVGLTQILAETATNLLGMRVDLAASARLTRQIGRGRRAAERVRIRRVADERFDPEKALRGAAKYLQIARERLGRDDLAVVSYHMGIGNLERALSLYGEKEVPYARLYFDSTPLRNADAWRFLSSLGDDSPTYLWRVYAARQIMRQWRDSPVALSQVAVATVAKASREEALHPAGSTPAFGEPRDIAVALARRRLVKLDPGSLARDGIEVSPRMGELARRLREDPALYRSLRPEAVELLRHLGVAVREMSGEQPLVVTSAVRDARYQRELVDRNDQATRNYSLHTTGWAFDIEREYVSREQARAFEFWLGRLQALDLIAWAREPAAIHVTVSKRAAELLGE